MGGGSWSVWVFPLKISILPNCLSVMAKMPILPSGGNIAFTRLICTSAFSRLLQCRRYRLNWNSIKPSSSICLRNRVYIFRSFSVTIGRSYITITHMIRYAFNRENIMFNWHLPLSCKRRIL